MSVSISTSTKDKRYYLKHRLKLLANLNKPVQCACGQTTTKSNFYNHLKSKRHNDLMFDKKQYQYCEICKTYFKNLNIHLQTKKHKNNMHMVNS